MSYNGSGTFLINSAGQPVVANTVISATVFNALTSDLATGLSTAITKDGQTTITANIPFGSNKITGLGSGTAATDAANLGQVQSTAAKLITVTGTDTITGSMSPALTAYAAGQLFYFVSAGANTGPVTINIDSLGAKSITRDGATALANGDINSGEVVVVIYDGTRFQMINAANSFGNTTINGTLTVTGNTGLQANVSITSTLSVGGTFAVTGAATLGSTLAVTGKSDLPTVSTASINAAVALITTGTVTNLTASGASIASANIGNLQFTAASIASINAGVAVITNLTATGASIASANVGNAVITAATVTGASIASANVGTAVITTGTVTNLTSTSASVASINAAVALITTGTVTNLTSTGASVASANVGVGVITALTATGASVASANVGTAVVTGLTVTNASIASLNAGTATVTSGNLTFSSTAQRITGDMSNATIANRLSFQTSTANSFTNLSLLPNGTGTSSDFRAYNNSDPTNAALAVFGTANSGTEVRLNSAITGTGTYLPMTFYTGGSERARIDTSGNVGIGTASPVAGYRLNVVNDSGNAQQLIRAGTNFNSTISFGDQDSSTSGQVLYAHNGDYMRFDTNGSERMRIDSSGNVGIGRTPTAGYRLDVAAATAEVLIESTTGTNRVDANLINTSGTFAIGIDSSAGGVYGTAYARAIFSTGAYPVTIFTNSSERMRIDSSGNVGIGGTAAANEKLAILGTFPTSSANSLGVSVTATIPNGTTSLAAPFSTYPTTAAASFTLTDLRHYSANAPTTFGAGSTVTNQYGFFVSSELTGATNNYGFYSNIASGSNRWNFYAAGTAQNYFAGNTGVGTTSPGARLDVQSAGNEVVKITATTGTNAVYQTMNNTAGSFTVGRENSAGTTFGVEAYSSALFSAGAYPMVFATNNVERMQISSVGNVKIGGTANRATTEGTRQLVLFNGTAPVGTLANGVSFYSASGEANVMDAAGNATLLSPHDSETNEWIFRSKHTPTGKVLKIDVEKMLRFINEHFGLDMVHEFTE